MSKTVTQLTEATTVATNDVLHIVDVSANQDKKIKVGNIWATKPYAQLYTYGNSTNTTISASSTLYYVTNSSAWTLTEGIKNLFTVDTATGVMTYTGTDTLIFDVQATLSWYFITAGATQVEAYAQVFKNGSRLDEMSVSQLLHDTATETQVTSFGGLVSLANGDTLDVRISNQTSTEDIRITEFNFNVKAL